VQNFALYAIFNISLYGQYYALKRVRYANKKLYVLYLV